MSIFESLQQTFPTAIFKFSLIIILAFFLFLILYSIIRALRLGEWGVIIGIGILFVGYSLVEIIPLIRSQPDQVARNMAAMGTITGVAATMTALYSFAQWTSRHWYRLIKRHSKSFLNVHARNIFLFLRNFHQFLGWAVLAIATIHAIFYFPAFATISLQKTLTMFAVLTGTIAWVILIILAGLGLLIEYAVKQKRLSPKARLFHFVISFVCLLFVLIHVGTRLVLK